ncbi:intermediate filament protein ifa-1-like [Acropora muricata]|uniref:intermediate filament protein ifa-1-like n=1 Tax=Acropora muricata TaxID=159855 RepID=UPI0034E3FCAF
MEAGFDGLRSELDKLRYELKNDIDQIRIETQGLKQSLEFTQRDLAVMKEKAEMDLQKTNEELETLRKRITSLELQLQTEIQNNIKLEQHTRRENLRFNNIEEIEGEDSYTFKVSFSDALERLRSNFQQQNIADILPGYQTDHSMITLQISLHYNTRGQGFGKLNTSFLNDTEYVNQIKSIIKQTKEEYAQDDTVHPNLLWEMVKLKVREESLTYGTLKNKKLSKKEEEIEQAIATLEKCLSEFNNNKTQSEKVWLELERKKRELEAIIEYRTKGAILRSKSQWYNEGNRELNLKGHDLLRPDLNAQFSALTKTGCAEKAGFT